jgi:ATPase subunit of ABC transporter with duplicated ATPase domains
MPSSVLLTVTDLAMAFGSELVFEGVGFQLAEKERAALVGVNGAGKSTLLRIIVGVDHPRTGTISLANGARLTYLPQEARFTSDRSLRDEARLGFADALAAGERMREIEQRMGDLAGDDLDALLAEYDRLSLHFETAGGYDIEHRTDQVLLGLGFTPEQFGHPVNQLSGGQKTRVALAKALLTAPDLLLLDEPTNHLDLAMVEWLEEFLQGWSGASLVVSHDRYFLDRVTSRTLDLSFGRWRTIPPRIRATWTCGKSGCPAGCRSMKNSRRISPGPRNSSVAIRRASGLARLEAGRHGWSGSIASSGRRNTKGSTSGSTRRCAAVAKCSRSRRCGRGTSGLTGRTSSCRRRS